MKWKNAAASKFLEKYFYQKSLFYLLLMNKKRKKNQNVVTYFVFLKKKFKVEPHFPTVTVVFPLNEIQQNIKNWKN